MPYVLKYLSTQQVQSLMGLSRAIAAHRSEGADFDCQDVDQIFESTPEEQALQDTIKQCDRNQKIELMVLALLGRTNAPTFEEAQRLSKQLSQNSDEHLQLLLTERGRTLGVYLGRAMTAPLHHRAEHV